MTTFAVGSLVAARGREWVVLPDSSDDFLVLRPLGGTDDDIAGVLPAIEPVTTASFPPPTADDLGDHESARLLRSALQIGFRSSAGPFRSLAGIAVEPRAYQLVPLLMALRQDTVRLLIADDVGIGKTIEASLIAAELLTIGDARGLAVLCSPALAEQWAGELRAKFGLEAELVLPSTVRRLERQCIGGESIFERFPITVVSTDFIKSDRRRNEFLRTCPDLVIVDEAHTCVADGGFGGKARTQRYDLVRALAQDASRHLLLVTATPHSGKDEAFRNLIGLLDPALHDLDLDQPKGRELLARHLVQRRRADIRQFLDEETPFPSDRQSKEVAYKLSPAYRDLFDDVIAYARETVSTANGAREQRINWWSVLALLRALASSPRAAAQTLATRSAALGGEDAAEADALGRSAVLDLADDETLESVDVAPGADASTESGTPQQRRLKGFLKRAKELEKAGDRKLDAITAQVKGLLADAYAPIVFCRFIDTAEYVAEHLTQKLGKGTTVACVTGMLPPSERVARIAELADADGPVVLVATDCLSEGVNLQDQFQAVVHYDLAWNPTRHEQREGRVDRFGQPRRRPCHHPLRPGQPHRRHRPRRPAPQARGDPQGDRRLGAGARQQRRRAGGPDGGPDPAGERSPPGHPRLRVRPEGRRARQGVEVRRRAREGVPHQVRPARHPPGRGGRRGRRDPRQPGHPRRGARLHRAGAHSPQGHPQDDPARLHRVHRVRCPAACWTPSHPAAKANSPS